MSDLASELDSKWLDFRSALSACDDPVERAVATLITVATTAVSYSQLSALAPRVGADAKFFADLAAAKAAMDRAADFAIDELRAAIRGVAHPRRAEPMP